MDRLIGQIPLVAFIMFLTVAALAHSNRTLGYAFAFAGGEAVTLVVALWWTRG